jgi:N-acetylmuramoyl-L-alanine amidase
MNISDHRIEGATFVAANASGGEMVPTLIILHDTAGRLKKASSVDWFKSSECPTSAHVVIERDGSITQMVPFNRKAWHAGPSVWNGTPHCNNFSIGIEIVNPGKLTKAGESARAWFNESWPLAEVTQKATKEHGAGYWMDYTPEQIAAVTELCKALAGIYDIQDITTHWAVSPGRKVDPNPLFPLDGVRKEVFSTWGTSVALAPTPLGAPVGSRKITTANAGQVGAVGGGLTLFGVNLADTIGYSDKGLAMVKAYGIEAAILGLFAVVVVCSAIKHFTKQDHAEGRYVSSGEAK